MARTPRQQPLPPPFPPPAPPCEWQKPTFLWTLATTVLIHGGRVLVQLDPAVAIALIRRSRKDGVSEGEIVNRLMRQAFPDDVASGAQEWYESPKRSPE